MKACGACQKPLEDDHVVSDQMVKFCNPECLKAAGHT